MPRGGNERFPVQTAGQKQPGGGTHPLGRSGLRSRPERERGEGRNRTDAGGFVVLVVLFVFICF